MVGEGKIRQGGRFGQRKTVRHRSGENFLRIVKMWVSLLVVSANMGSTGKQILYFFTFCVLLALCDCTPTIYKRNEHDKLEPGKLIVINILLILELQELSFR